MSNQEMNQSASEPSEGGFTMKPQTKESFKDLKTAKTDDASKTAATAPNSTKRTPAKAKSKKSDKKTAEAAQKVIEEKIAIEAIVVQIKHCKTQAKLCKDQQEQFFFEMGKWLGEAKDKVKKVKGLKWLEWLRDNFDMTARSAQMYMETYNAFADNMQEISHLGYTKASMLATLPADKRNEFLSKQQYEIKDGEFKSAEEMTTREFERAVREYKEHKTRPIPQKVSVEGLNKKLSSLSTQLNDLLNSLSKVEGDPSAYQKLYETLSEMLNNSVTKLSEQPTERMSSDVPTVSNEPTEEIKQAS